MKSGEQVSWRKLVGVEGSPHTADQQLEALGDSPKALQYHISQPSGTPMYKPQGGWKKCRGGLENAAPYLLGIVEVDFQEGV